MPVGTTLAVAAGMAVEDFRPPRTTGTAAVGSHPPAASVDSQKIARLRLPGRAQTDHVLIVVSCFFSKLI